MNPFKGPRRKTAVVVTAIAAAVVVTGGTALAAMLITGSGKASASAYTAQSLTVTNEAFAPNQVYPGIHSTLTFDVSNPNPFPVTIQQIGYDASRASEVVLSCGGATPTEQNANLAKLSGPVGTVGFVYSLTAAQQVTIPAKNGSGNGTGTVTIANALNLDAAATQGCSVTLPFKVTGAGAGN